MSMQDDIDPAAHDDAQDGEDVEKSEKRPTPQGTALLAWRASDLLRSHLEACSRAELTSTDPKLDDDRRDLMLRLLETAWSQAPNLTLGQLVERLVHEAGEPQLGKVSDVALVHALASMSKPVEEF